MIAKIFCMRGNCEGLSFPRRESFFLGGWGFFMGILREVQKPCREGSRIGPTSIRKHACERSVGLQLVWSGNVRAELPATAPPDPPVSAPEALATAKPNPPPSSRHPPLFSRAPPPFSPHPPPNSRHPPTLSEHPPPLSRAPLTRSANPPTLASHPPTPSEPAP